MTEMVYPWQDGVWKTLQAYLLTDKLPHALLFTGASGIGKAHLAAYFAKTLICESASSQRPCGTCQGCIWFAAHTHPDIMHVRTAPDKMFIQVDQIRELAGFINLSASRSKVRVAILYTAERMHAAAANALLKTLEEPPSGAILILLSSYPARLLATVRSRCQMIKLVLPPKELVSSWLMTKYPLSTKDMHALLALTHDAPLKAQAMLDGTEENIAAKWLDELSLLGKLLRAEITPISLAAQWQHEPLAALMERLYLLCTDIIKVHLQAGDVMHTSGATSPQHLQCMVKVLTLKQLFALQQKLLEGRRLADTTANSLLLLESLFIDFCQHTNTPACKHERV